MSEMSPANPQPPAEAMDRYLDGVMTAEERAEFERQFGDNALFAATLQRQQEVDAALVEYAQPPSPQRALDAIRRRAASGGAAASAPNLRLRLSSAWRRLAVAAVVLLGIFGAWQIYQVMTSAPSGNYDTGPHRTLLQAYHETVDSGFKEEWVCSDDAVFAMVFKDAFGQMLSMNLPLPAGVDAKGLNFFNILSRKTIGVLALVDETPVMVFVDRLDHDDSDQPAPQGDLHVFRRELDELVLYEVTPLDHPSLLNHLREPEQIPAPDRPGQPGK